MESIQKRLRDLSAKLADTWQKLQLDQKLARLEELEQITADPELWKDPQRAQNLHRELSQLTNSVQPWRLLKTQVADLDEIITLGDNELITEAERQIEILEQNLEELKKELRFTGEFDSGDAILRITAGVGGVEAMDWASMLERMYLRFAENKDFKVTCLERSTGEEAGIKTAVYEIHGQNAYGLLKSEHGVHRLVRLSPFNADNLRQTSFALVEVLPVVSDNEKVKIEDKDLRIDVYHADRKSVV